MTTPTPNAADELPPLPEPFTVASTIKCTACGAPYAPPMTLMGGAAQWAPGRIPPHACRCGNTQFGGTISSESLSPARFTADQMNTRWLDGYAAGRASRVQGEASALSMFHQNGSTDDLDAIERLRFFCSFAMKGQDWLDCEPFFDALTAPQAETLAVAEGRDWVLRAKVADLLHLLKHASLTAPSLGDEEQARHIMLDLRTMLDTAPAPTASIAPKGDDPAFNPVWAEPHPYGDSWHGIDADGDSVKMTEGEFNEAVRLGATVGNPDLAAPKAEGDAAWIDPKALVRVRALQPGEVIMTSLSGSADDARTLPLFAAPVAQAAAGALSEALEKLAEELETGHPWITRAAASTIVRKHISAPCARSS